MPEKNNIRKGKGGKVRDLGRSCYLGKGGGNTRGKNNGESASPFEL